MDLTSPICTPRNFTLAPFSITSPDRSETSVSGTFLDSVPENSIAVIAISAAAIKNSTGAHQMGSMPPRRGEFSGGLSVIRSPRQVEVAGLAVDGQRDGQQDEDARGDRHPHRTADRLTDTRGPPVTV